MKTCTICDKKVKNLGSHVYHAHPESREAGADFAKKVNGAPTADVLKEIASPVAPPVRMVFASVIPDESFFTVQALTRIIEAGALSDNEKRLISNLRDSVRRGLVDYINHG